MSNVPDLNAPAIGISLTHTVAENRNVVMQAFVPADCTDADLNAVLDKCFRATARQEALARLPVAKARLDNERKMYERCCEDLVRIDAESAAADQVADELHSASGRRGPRQFTAQQRQDEAKRQADRANAMTTVQRYKYDIAKLEAEIADLTATIAGG